MVRDGGVPLGRALRIKGLMKPFEELVSTSATSDLCVFGYDTPNLGDCMQTLALLQHVRPREFVLRDTLPPRTDLMLLANGWLSHGKFPRRVDFQRIRYAGIHLAEEFRTSQVVDELQDSGTIGCRDTLTLEFLARHGVPAVLSRCATLTFPLYTGERRGIVCVDVDERVIQRVAWKYAGNEPISRFTHVCSWLGPNCVQDGTLMARMRDAYDHLQIYRKARLVVTTKVHVALPSLASGTPVVYIGPRDDRIGVFDGLPLGEGWEQYRWFRVLPPKMHPFPKPISTKDAAANYLSVLNTLLADTRTSGSRA